MSSRRRQRRRACESKTSYASTAEAMGNVKRLRRGGERVHVYRCAFCGCFHIGHVPFRVRQGIAARRRAAS